jgi:3',5'-cyclic-AMP phosphodiesterase
MDPASSPSPAFSRRDFLKKTSLSVAGLGLAGVGFHPPGAGDEFSFVHLTDMHVRRKRLGHEGYARCIEQVNRLRPRPAFVLMGGDGPFDGLYTEKEEFADQIDLFREISERLEMPFYHCLGNHDLLGLSGRRKVPVDDPDLGKKFIQDRLNWEKTYYSFNARGWHFVVLDSIDPVMSSHGPSYVPRLWPEQLDWLRYDLGAHHGMPTVAVIHIPAFSHIGQIRGDREMRAVHDRVIHNGRDVRLILERHGVKALLQGHIHKPEDFFFNGVWYISSQSVSAAWWGGNWRGFKPGFTIFTARGDQLLWRRQEFAWEHRLEPEDDLERQRIEEHEQFLREQQRLLAEERAGPA